MEKLNPIEMYQKLIHVPHIVRTIRISCFAGYWYCSEKARQQALGIQSTESSPEAATGTLIHNNILTARKPSPLELELQEALKPFYTTGEDGEPIISRCYKNTKIQADGQFLTHGVDEWKVSTDRKAWLLEYKTKGSDYVSPIDLAPARFQNKLACWLFAPIFSVIPFTLAGGQIIFLKRVGRNGNFEPIGQTEQMFWNEETELQLLADIERILWSWDNPEKQIPPKRWKCLRCPPIYKSRCVFQK